VLDVRAAADERERDDQLVEHIAERLRARRGTPAAFRLLDELLGVLERLDAEDMAEEATRLGAATTSLFAEAYRELAADAAPAAAVGDR
jgi:hypothetical protein